MAIERTTPDVAGLTEVVGALREWQDDDAPVQLHPGDLGWFWRFGAETTAAATRTWSRDGCILAVGLLDGPMLLRLAIAPSSLRDEELARRIADDATRPECGVLPEGQVFLAAAAGAVIDDVLDDGGWSLTEPWTPLQRDLADPVQDPGMRVELVGPDTVHLRTEVQRAAFDGSTFTDERWHDMAAAEPFEEARDLLGYDDRGRAVAAVTVWSAGAGRPGLIEPLGVHRDHRGHGYGTAITLAAAAALRELGSSSVLVCTPSSNVVGIAAYRSGGFQPLPELVDRSREP